MHGDRLWAGFLGFCLGAFGLLEWLGYNGGRHGTLSAALRRWLGVHPAAKRRWLAGGLFGGALAGLIVHILVD